MRFVHFEVIRMGLLRKLDWSRMFAIWRVDSPWQAVTKKVNLQFVITYILQYYKIYIGIILQGQGQRMGGGKGSIDHYVTPVRSGRIIIEISGHCEYAEVSLRFYNMKKL